jgi:phenylalanyl-tRNA synthetase beta chain
MKISYGWLKEFIPLKNSSPEEISRTLASIGFEVSSIVKYPHQIKNIVTAEILSVKPHPNADKLSLCSVSDGKKQYPIVCGAKNISKGDYVPLALSGAVLADGTNIKATTIRGVKSEGMLCSSKELGIDDDHTGIMILQRSVKPGKNIVDIVPLDDTVLDVEIPANRGDCLGHLGIARELAVKLKLPLTIPPVHTSDRTHKDIAFRVNILEKDLCSRYVASVLENVKLSGTPAGIKLRLERCGIRSVNCLVDITNYVMLEIGRPLHLFDYHKLSGKCITVRKAKDSEKICALDLKTYSLKSDMLVIADSTNPQAIAGIIGADGSGVSGSTGTVVLESAVFNPQNIRKARVALGLDTEASYRFERSSSYEMCELGNRRAVELIIKNTDGMLVCMHDIKAKEYVSPKIILREERIEQILSTKYKAGDVVDTLSRLGLEVKLQPGDKNKVLAKIPSYRSDLKEEIDLIEEVARMQGYENIPSDMRTYNPNIAISDPLWQAENILRSFLLSQGIQEVLNYSICSKQVLEDTKSGKEPIKIVNPISAEYELLRSSMLPGLLNNLMHNYRNQVEDMKFFELGKVFSVESGLPEEVESLGIICTGLQNPSSWGKKGETVDFYYMIGIIEKLFSELGCEKSWSLRDSTEKYFHPAKSAVIAGDKGEVYAEVGLLNPALCQEFPNDIYYAEIDISKPISAGPGIKKTFKAFTRLPVSKRDISIVAPEKIHYREIADKILSLQEKLNIEVELFDLYRGDKIDTGKKSLGLRLYISHPGHTLSDEEINKKISEIVTGLKSIKVSLRS